jgi:hypothetical protein
MNETTSFKRLILRAVLREVSPMVIRLVSASDQVDLPQFHEIFSAILGWSGDLGYLISVHGQEFNSFRRKTRSKALHEFKLHRHMQRVADVKERTCSAGTYGFGWRIAQTPTESPTCPRKSRSRIRPPAISVCRHAAWMASEVL